MHAKVQLIPSIRSRVMMGTKFGFIHTYIYTYIFWNLLFWLRNLKNLEIHKNLWFENFHRYKAFSLRKQKNLLKKTILPKLLCFLNKALKLSTRLNCLKYWRYSLRKNSTNSVSSGIYLAFPPHLRGKWKGAFFGRISVIILRINN